MRILIILFWWQKLSANLRFLISRVGRGRYSMLEVYIQFYTSDRSKGLHIPTTYAVCILEIQCLMRVIIKSITTPFVYI